eukprot:g280.t1
MLQEQQTMLLLVAQSVMDPWGKTSTHQTESESETVRKLVTKYYALPGRRRCQILTNLSRCAHPHVVNLHIWPEHAAAYHGLEPENVNSPRNILRVNRAIERKFDNKDLTFELRENQLCLKADDDDEGDDDDDDDEDEDEDDDEDREDDDDDDDREDDDDDEDVDDEDEDDDDDEDREDDDDDDEDREDADGEDREEADDDNGEATLLSCKFRNQRKRN